MKNLWIVLLLLLPIISFCQGSNSDKEEIWKEVVVHIQRNELSEVLNKTQFPIKVGEDELSKEQFVELYPSIFYKDILSDFEVGGYEGLDLISSGIYSYMLIGRDEKFDFADLVFQKVNESWYLVAVELEKYEQDEIREFVDKTAANSGTVLYSEYCEITGGQITLFLKNKSELACEENHICAFVENVNAKEIILTSSGGSLNLEEKETLSYLYTIDCSVDKHFIAISHRTAEGEYIHLSKIDLYLH